MAALPSLDTAVSRPPSGIASPPHRMPTSRSRTQSISSDRPSTIGHGFMSPPLSISPEAAFIAASAASQIVTNDHDSHADAWYDQHGVEPSGETALISPAALQLVNNFLDQLLFNFLSVSRSTSLSALRPAVSEVLKPKLAKDAINQADEELREYLGGGDDEDLMPSQDQVSSADWDLELVWKRTRLRCMVYSSLGDMEEEDEDFYMEQEHLDAGLEDRLSDVVSPAVAIFLTSILEFMGEQALVVAGQAAYHRMRVKYGKDLKDGVRSPSDIADRIMVEELDMERVALDRTLGRLWRAWKKKIRSPGIGIGMDHALARTYSRESLRGSHLRSPSLTAEATVPATVREPPAEEPDQPALETPVAEEADAQDLSLGEYELAVGIPLPIGPRDVDEIEVPGLASYSDDEGGQFDEADGVDEMLAPRPKSLMIFPRAAVNGPPTPTGSQPHTPIFATRKRSNSLPTPAATPYNSSPKHLKAEPLLATADRHSPDSVSDVPAPSDKTSSESLPQEQIPETEQTEETGETVSIGSSSALSDERNLITAFESVASVSGGPEVTVRSIVPEADGDDEEPDEEVDEIDELVEEPQILTSSRISISGRSASPTTSERGKPLTINANLPARTPSMHSLRLIEVSSPRSPVPRSRGSSVDPAEHVRGGTLSRTNSVRTPPIAEETSRVHPPTNAHPATALHLSRSTGPANESISEAEETVNVGHRVSAMVPEDTVTVDPTATPSPTDYYAQAGNPEAIFGSSARSSSTAASPAKSSATKVTILSSSTTPGTFFIQDPPEESDVRPSRTRKGAPVHVSIPSPPPPAVPERSPSRQALASSPATGSPTSQPTSIGIVSVDRPRARTSSETSGPKGQDSNAVTASRPLHASGSSTSSARLKAMRTSEDSSHTQADVMRNFEQLIQSDQTIQYTLTPESMRDIDTQPTRGMASGSPVVPVKSRKSEEARQPGERSRSSSVNNKPQSEVKRSTSISRSTGLHSHPINEGPANGVRGAALAGRPAPVVASKPRINNPQARDARLPRESLADLAEFLRSTGPNGASTTPAGAGLGNGAVPRVGGPTAVRSASGPMPVGGSLDSDRASTSSNPNRIRLQARGAAVDYKDDNSDLIDFIRRGPPVVAGGHRIPRNVAPFRTTMDSDQMSGAVGGRAVDAQIREVDARNSQASTNITESSFNSQSALLGRVKPASGTNSRFGGVDEDEMPIPKRKTRRVRDPYAIDLSDEDEIEEEPTPRPNRRAPPQEESLADFLKNYTPPPEPAPVPQNRPKKKASAPSLMSRFGRRDNAPSGAGSGGVMGPRSPTKGVPESRSLNSRAGGGRGYIPIQVNIPSGADTYGTSAGYGQPSASSQFTSSNGNMGAAQGRRVPMKKFEPRDAVSVPSRGTSDLAAFLKNSEPPPAMMVSGQLASPRDDNGSLSKVFSRRKKPSIA